MAGLGSSVPSTSYMCFLFGKYTNCSCFSDYYCLWVWQNESPAVKFAAVPHAQVPRAPLHGGKLEELQRPEDAFLLQRHPVKMFYVDFDMILLLLLFVFLLLLLVEVFMNVSGALCAAFFYRGDVARSQHADTKGTAAGVFPATGAWFRGCRQVDLWIRFIEGLCVGGGWLNERATRCVFYCTTALTAVS
ncbi:hypothetical protein TraAM80_09663 [Trypanosoma rangeli]|uniref:Uncharacterized protein n=1 Tax=Trypanosoma rangeli TaxID=5698 RepID=A0A3R7JTS9_TRYRA|nr:uncharacterized protein TraAM80_09663 [Trypanosoma rangeli]RNE96719.1 hypothetical protein TraAM80_09663 [Trypanosoma rangeli]|eukprot:RNE96719.1 hypothetical protein TraAM80_09663 [Trypanosoma rangeli]